MTGLVPLSSLAPRSPVLASDLVAVQPPGSQTLMAATAADVCNATGLGAVVTVSALPVATISLGVRTFVNDNAVAAATHFGAVAVGGGANIVPVWSDGSVWRIG